MKHIGKTAALVATLLAVALPGAQAQSVMKDIVYAEVDGRKLALDIHLPRGDGARPLVVYIHGGIWRMGTKASQVPTELVDAGFALASIDFRQSPEARFPAQMHDIKAALRFLRANASDYGYTAERIAVTGLSSGAHLALLTGVTNGDAELEGTLGAHTDTSSDVQAILSYYAASDLTTILSQSTPFGLEVREPGLQLLLGALPDQVPELAQLASPVYHVDAGDPPLLLLHGDRDPQMPVNQSLQMQGAYDALGLDVYFDAVHGAAHGGPEFLAGEHLARAVEFLERTLGRE